MAANSAKSAKKRGPGRPFAPGRSGNPSGRKPIPQEIKALFAAATVPVAEALIATAIDRTHEQHVKAAIHVLERSLGKVPQPMQHSGAEGGPLTLTVLQQLDDAALVAKASAMLRARAAEEPEAQAGVLPPPQSPPMTDASDLRVETIRNADDDGSSTRATGTVPTWFAQLLRTYPRIAIAGGPRTGKTTLSVCALAIAPGIRIEHTDDLIGRASWDDVPTEVEARVRRESRYVLEGVQVGRCLRNGLEVDAVVWLDVPHVKLTDEQESMRKGCVTIFAEWRRDALLSGAWDQTDLPGTHGATIYTRKAAP